MLSFQNLLRKIKGKNKNIGNIMQDTTDQLAREDIMNKLKPIHLTIRMKWANVLENTQLEIN